MESKMIKCHNSSNQYYSLYSACLQICRTCKILHWPSRCVMAQSARITRWASELKVTTQPCNVTNHNLEHNNTAL